MLKKKKYILNENQVSFLKTKNQDKVTLGAFGNWHPAQYYEAKKKEASFS